jgi:hypothetical protein
MPSYGEGNLNLIGILPLDGISLILEDPDDASLTTLAFALAEPESSAEISAITERGFLGVSESVCHRIIATGYFPFNIVDELRLDLNLIDTHRLFSASIVFASLEGQLGGGSQTLTIPGSSSGELEQIACSWGKDPHGDRGLRLKITVEGIFSLPLLGTIYTP